MERALTVTAPPDPAAVQSDIAQALAEDIGSGDLTAQLIPEASQAEATVISREEAVICGTPWFNAVFHRLDPRVHIEWRIGDGDIARANQVLCSVAGPARALLSGERTALNFLQTLSGTATRARRYVTAVAGTGVKILDTRKTLPGLRMAQKYATRCGGAYNHRLGLYDAILIKENHILAAGSIGAAVAAARRAAPDRTVEVEVEDLEELRQAIAAGAEMILLDNFTPQTLTQAVELNQRRSRLEASGGITLDNVRRIAETGVDFISIGAITKDVQAVDLSMRFKNT